MHSRNASMKAAKKKRKKSAKKAPSFFFDRILFSHEKTLVLSLCVLAALRILIFSAAFPLFTNVDEQSHFDLVIKSSNGSIPHGLENYSQEAAASFVIYGSPEYSMGPDDSMAPKIWTLPRDLQNGIVKQGKELWKGAKNPETTQPPVYYLAAGAWYKLGSALGLDSRQGFYWIRSFNVIVYILLILIAYACLKRVYPNRPLLSLGVPLVLAFFPQDAFYSVGNDVTSPLLFCAAFYALLLCEGKGWGSHFLAGMAVAMALLSKYSCCPILVVMAAIAAIRVRNSWKRETRISELAKIGIMTLAAAAPIAWWCARNYVFTGHLITSGQAAEFLGWTVKPFDQIWDHPLFTLSGAWGFCHDVMLKFWRGEFTWYKRDIALPWADEFYAWSSLAFAVVAAWQIARPRLKGESQNRLADSMNLAVLIGSLLLLAILSIRYDFHDCFYPSRAYPFMSSGRLILGILVPFLVLYISGLDLLLGKLGIKTSRLMFLAGIMLVITCSEIAITIPVFSSPWNWFH
jgi:hypothetical protein